MNNTFKAIIDIGSLKVKIMIFDTKRLDLVLQKSYLTLLGKGISEQGNVINEALDRLDEALISIKIDLDSFKCNDVQFIATESLRMAKNKESVYKIIKKHFPNNSVKILDQNLEGEIFFRAVSHCFINRPIVAIDVGGGSVQVIHGIYNGNLNQPAIYNKYLYKTGTYKLQQKYSPDNSIISQDFNKAIEEVKEEFGTLNISSDILVFGSSCMQDFLKESGIYLYDNIPFNKHSIYTTVDHLKNLLNEIRKFPPNGRTKFYPSGEYFIYGADYLLISVIEAAERLGAKYIYPTNLNSSYGFI